jgi:hypothetical protein
VITKGQRDLFHESIIAQDDDKDYSGSGYVAVCIGDWCAISPYSHCSCFDTWASLTGGGIGDDEGPGDPSWSWTGTPDELLAMAHRVADPAIPDRDADPDDCDYDHLCEMYRQVIAHFEGAAT